MGEFTVSGNGAALALDQILSTNLATLPEGKCRYGFLLNQSGGVIDDLITYRLEAEKFLLVVNASRIERDFSVICELLPAKVNLENLSDKMGKIDLQGPLAREVLQNALPGPWTELGYFSFTQARFKGEELIISRTGYTGELGYEIYFPAGQAVKIWELLLGHELVKPAGLGARDTLRLEAGLPLNGQDLDEEHTPAEAGYSSMLTSEADYVGKANASAIREQLVALNICGKRSARQGHKLLLPDAREAGTVTSGSFAPSLGHAVALAYVKKEFANQEKYLVQADKTLLEASRTVLPFYTKGTARIKI
jgi:aminomethyltransferase